MRKVPKFALYETTLVVVLLLVMSALHGDLSEFDVASVLGLLSDLRKTGELSFSGDRGSALVGFDRGSIVWSECSAAPHSTAPADVVFELLRFSEASFEFESLPKPARNRDSEEVTPVLAAATEQLGEWREVEKVVASGDVVVTLAQKLPADEVVIRRSGWDLIHAIGSGQSVTSIGATMQLNELRATRLVKELAEDGLIELNGRNLTDPDSVETKPASDAEAVDGNADGNDKATDSAKAETTATESKPEVNKAKENKAEANKAAEDKAKENKAKENKAEENKAGKGTGSKAEENKAGKGTGSKTDAAAKKSQDAEVAKADASSAKAAGKSKAKDTPAKNSAKDTAGKDLPAVTAAAAPTDDLGEESFGEPIEIDALEMESTKEMPGIDLVADESQSFDDFPPPPAAVTDTPASAGSDLPPPPPAIDVPPVVTVGDAADSADAAEGDLAGAKSARSRLDKMASELGLDMDEDDADPVDLDAELRPSSTSDSSLVEQSADKGRWRPFRSRG